MNFPEQALAYLRSHGVEWTLRFSVALLIALGGYFAARVLSRLTAKAIIRSGGHRAVTLAPILRTLVFVVTFSSTSIMALDHVGVDIATILASAGVLGLAVGFGSQTLVKDCLSGFFLILDDVLAEGDWVEVDGVDGEVESVGLRVTQIRAFSGQLWYVPNGAIQRVGNWNRDWARAVVEVGLAYEQDIAKGLEVMQRVGESWAEQHPDIVLAAPEAQAALGFSDSSVKVRLVIKIDNAKHDLWPAQRKLRADVKTAFDAAGVEIPFPRSVVYHRNVSSNPIKPSDERDEPQGEEAEQMKE